MKASNSKEFDALNNPVSLLSCNPSIAQRTNVIEFDPNYLLAQVGSETIEKDIRDLSEGVEPLPLESSEDELSRTVFIDYISMSFEEVSDNIRNEIFDEIWNTGGYALDDGSWQRINYNPQVAFRELWRDDVGSRAYVGNYIDRNGETIPDKNRVEINLSGKYLERLTIEDQIYLVGKLTELGGKATRLDACLEDRNRNIPFQSMLESAKDGNFTGARKWSVIISGEIDKMSGLTLNLGSRESDSYTRVYETSYKHGYPGIRIERECKGNHAIFLQNRIVSWYYLQNNESQLLTETEKDFADWATKKGLVYRRWADRCLGELARFTVSHIDFIDRSGLTSNGHLIRASRLKFWADFLSGIGDRIKIKVQRLVPTLNASMQWVRRQAATTLAIIYEALGEKSLLKFISSLLANVSNHDRLKSKHLLLIANAEEYGELGFTQSLFCEGKVEDYFNYT